jgi:regulator of sigma E protease
MANILLAILAISLLMIVHEGGHYLMARASGIRVLTFSIGFGPALVRFRPKGSDTTVQLCVIPLLAFVRLAGAGPLEENDPKDDGLYANKSLAARALTLAGGPVANYLFASILVFGVALTGWPKETPTSPMVVESVSAGSPAERAGLRPGDAVLEIDGAPVRDIGEVSARNAPRAGEPTRYLVRRGDTSLDVTITPQSTHGRGTIGVSAKSTVRAERLSIGEAAALAIEQPWTITVENLRALGDLVKRRSTEGLVGPVGMTKSLARETSAGPSAFLLAIAAVSVGLGLFNLLPLPFLDGGRLLFLGVELVTGRRPNRTAEALVHAAGMLLLLGAAVAVTWRDIVG